MPTSPDRPQSPRHPTVREMRRLLRAEERDESRRRRQLAWERARAVAKLLHERYGAAALYLYRSLAWGGFRPGSDIDLLIIGGPPPAKWWQMEADAEATAAPFPVSIVSADRAPPTLGEKVFSQGVRLR